MRNVSNEILDVINSKGYSSYWLVDLHLPTQGDIPAVDLYISDSEVKANGHTYKPLLRVQKPRMIQTLGRAPDGGSITIDNIEGTIGQALLARGRNFEGAKFVLWKAFLLQNDQLGIDKWMEGDIRSASISESDQTITFQLNSDLLKRQSVMGAWMLSQRCIVPFNKDGLLSPAESRCGWQVAQGGVPESCDKTEDGQNGCRAHGNLHRIVAVPAITASLNVTTLPGGMGGGGGGFPIDGPPTCFLAGTQVLMADGSSLPIEEIQVGDMVLSPIYYKELEKDVVVPCRVSAVMQNTSKDWFRINCLNVTVEVTARHLFYTGAGTFRPIEDICTSENIRIFDPETRKFADSEVIFRARLMREVKVYNLTVEKSHTYFANLVAVHNEKWEYPEFPTMM